MQAVRVPSSPVLIAVAFAFLATPILADWEQPESFLDSHPTDSESLEASSYLHTDGSKGDEPLHVTCRESDSQLATSAMNIVIGMHHSSKRVHQQTEDGADFSILD